MIILFLPFNSYTFVYWFHALLQGVILNSRSRREHSHHTAGFNENTSIVSLFSTMLDVGLEKNSLYHVKEMFLVPQHLKLLTISDYKSF